MLEVLCVYDVRKCVKANEKIDVSVVVSWFCSRPLFHLHFEKQANETMLMWKSWDICFRLSGKIFCFHDEIDNCVVGKKNTFQLYVAQQARHTPWFTWDNRKKNNNRIEHKKEQRGSKKSNNRIFRLTKRVKNSSEGKADEPKAKKKNKFQMNSFRFESIACRSHFNRYCVNVVRAKAEVIDVLEWQSAKNGMSWMWIGWNQVTLKVKSHKNKM